MNSITDTGIHRFTASTPNQIHRAVENRNLSATARDFFITAAKVPMPPPISMPRRIAELADLANCMNCEMGRSSSEVKIGKGVKGREEGGFDGVFEKHRLRGSGWQPLRISVSWRSGSKGQVEKGEYDGTGIQRRGGREWVVAHEVVNGGAYGVQLPYEVVGNGGRKRRLGGLNGGGEMIKERMVATMTKRRMNSNPL
ncbi:hypothetical protein F3Y22_tig00013285pilonHSYRG00127 [Hibiscus syriacus]|uniref:Uncharacterized protein n=1 Tax=Hibiscus syriacus TaxID=106335 RepID=A0A6A3C3R6_HIBSY|nr:hypothetical protein F3Y22_tig00013285pilonHSYRG00127 [Hibiscus syriacus]